MSRQTLHPAPQRMHPSEVLFQGKHRPVTLPVCDHYAGSEKLMRKSLALQQELGVPVRFVGTGEREHDFARFDPKKFAAEMF